MKSCGKAIAQGMPAGIRYCVAGFIVCFEGRPLRPQQPSLSHFGLALPYLLQLRQDRSGENGRSTQRTDKA